MAFGNLNSEVSVSIVTGSGAVPVAGFGVPLFLDEQSGTLATNRIAFYADADEVDADGDLSAESVLALKAALAQTPTPSRVAAGHWDVTGSESLTDALTAVKAANNNWYGLAVNSRVKADIVEVATWVETATKLFSAQSADSDLKAGTTGNIADTLKTAARRRTFVSFHDPDTEDYFDMGIIGKGLAVDLDSQTTLWKYKTVSGAEIDDLTTTEINAIREDNGNVYEEFGGQGAFANGRVADGLPIDIVTTIDWLEARINEGLQQLFLDYSNRNDKIPFTDEGIQLVAGVIEGVIRTGERAGHFTKGTYTPTIPLERDIVAADKTARLLRISFVVEAAGAIESVTVNGTLVTNL